MAERAVYFKGIHLWQHFQYWTPIGARGDDTQHLGVGRLRELNNPRSPNFGSDIEVHTHVDKTDAHGDLSLATTLELLWLQLAEELQDNAASLGDLAWVDDPDRKADVTVGPYAPGSNVPITHGALGGSWAPAVGRYVLLRKPTTGEGFTTTLTAVGAGTVTLAAVPVQIDSAWDMLDAQIVLPDVVYHSMDPGSALDAGDREDWRPDVAFQFHNPASVRYSTDHLIPRGNV